MPSRRQLQRTVVAVGLLVLVALSGCAGLSDTGSSTPSPVGPATATPSVTQTPTASPAMPNATSSHKFPAGLNDTAVRNVTQVVRAHQETAIETQGIVTHTTDSTTRGRSVNASVRVAAETNLTRVRYLSQAQAVTENETRNTTTAIVANETSVKQYTAVNGNITLDNRQNRTDLFDRALRGLSTGTNPLRGMLRRGNFTVTDESGPKNAEPVTLRSDRYAGGRLFDDENVVAYNATVQITADGLVRSAAEHIVAQRDGNESQYSFTYDFEPQSVDILPVPQVPADIRIRSGTTSND